MVYVVRLFIAGVYWLITIIIVFCNKFILDRLHFEVPLDSSTPNPYSCSYTPSNPYCDSPNAPSSPGDLELTNLDNGYYGPHSGGNAGSHPPAPRQKGRPRKRKPKDIEAMTSNLGELKVEIIMEAVCKTLSWILLPSKERKKEFLELFSLA